MYNPEFSDFTMYPTNLNPQQPLPPLLFVNPFIMQQHLGFQADTGFYGLPFCAVPVLWGITPQHQPQYQAPSPGPSHYQRSRGSHMAEPQPLHKFSHKSFGMIAGDHSTSIHPGHARMDAGNNSGAGKQTRTKPYDRYRSSRSWRKPPRTDKVDPSVYKIPTVESKRGAMVRHPYIPTPAPATLSTWATAPAPSTPSLAASTSTASESTSYTRNTNAEKQPVEDDDDFDTVSLGSD